MEGLLTSAGWDTCLIVLLDGGQRVPDSPGNREGMSMWSQWSESKKQKPQGSLEAQGGPILL